MVDSTVSKDGRDASDVAALKEEVTSLRRELTVLRARLRRADRNLAVTHHLVSAVRTLSIWDYSPYEISPGDDWVAIDRACAAELLAALAEIDHWTPWTTRLEPRVSP